jgi:predicted N-acyltransferase
MEIRTHQSINSIDKHRWNELKDSDYPFLRHEFLAAMENSGSVSTEQGWQPCHLELIEQGETLIYLPLYIKYHSWGEYVFDQSWANAFHQSGLNYYPKLLSAIPFTPSTGPRWLGKLEPEDALQRITQSIKTFAREYKLESWHLLYPEDSSIETAQTNDLLVRTGLQYQWFNRDYRDFSHFLEGLTSRKRKELRKEREKNQAFEFKHLSGSEITSDQLKQFYDLYSLTYLKRGRDPYLDQSFFAELVQTMPEQMLFVFAQLEGEIVAGALSFHDSASLYGRYWGCYEEYDALHFETCYYQGIDYCIKHQLERFDSGAQGEHKIKRGFEPVFTHSVHWVNHPEFHKAIANFVDEEHEYLSSQKSHLSERLPFKNTDL